MSGPLLTLDTQRQLGAALAAGRVSLDCSLDLQRSLSPVQLHADRWTWQGQDFPFPQRCKERTIYYWDGSGFEPVARFAGALIKLVPTDWGAPTFEIDGIKMLPTARESPLDDARRKVALVQPAGKVVLDTCGGLGYFATCALEAGATQVCSFERNAEVLWLRSINPWSPDAHAHADRFSLQHADVLQAIDTVPDASFGAALHDPPRFGIAGELYSAAFYAQLARVLKRGARLFHYTGTPNKLSSGRDLPREVARRLQTAGFKAEPALDGVIAIRR